MLTFKHHTSHMRTCAKPWPPPLHKDYSFNARERRFDNAYGGHGGFCMAKLATLSPLYRAFKSVSSRLKEYRTYREGRAIFHKFNASLAQAIKYEGSRKGNSQ